MRTRTRKTLLNFKLNGRVTVTVRRSPDSLAGSSHSDFNSGSGRHGYRRDGDRHVRVTPSQACRAGDAGTPSRTRTRTRTRFPTSASTGESDAATVTVQVCDPSPSPSICGVSLRSSVSQCPTRSLSHYGKYDSHMP
jgi:hypothetical protein